MVPMLECWHDQSDLLIADLLIADEANLEPLHSDLFFYFFLIFYFLFFFYGNKFVHSTGVHTVANIVLITMTP